MNAFYRLTSIINLYNENMNLELTIKKLGLVYKFRVGRATRNEHIFYFGLRHVLKLSIWFEDNSHESKVHFPLLFSHWVNKKFWVGGLKQGNRKQTFFFWPKSSTKFLFFGPICQQKWSPCPLIDMCLIDRIYSVFYFGGVDTVNCFIFVFQCLSNCEKGPFLQYVKDL